MVATPSSSHFGHGVSVHRYMTYAKKPGGGRGDASLNNTEYAARVLFGA